MKNKLCNLLRKPGDRITTEQKNNIDYDIDCTKRSPANFASNIKLI